MTSGVEREITGRARDLQDVVYDTETEVRPPLKHPNVPENTRAAITSATESMRVTGGVPPTAMEINTEAIATAASLLSAVNERTGDVLLSTSAADLEVAAWSATGHPLLTAAWSAAAGAKAALGGLQGRITLAHVKLAAVGQQYESVEASVGSLFGPATAIMPGWNLTGSATRGIRTTLEQFTRSVKRAGIDTPEEFAAKVRVTSFGVVVLGGGPEGTNAVIRGVGLEDTLDAPLRLPLPAGLLRGTRAHSQLGGGTGEQITLGQYLRVWADDLLTGIGASEAHDSPQQTDFPADSSVLWPVVGAAAKGLSGRPGFEWFKPFATGRRLAPAERVPYPLVRKHALRPTAKETMTGVTPANAREHGIAGLSRRPLPRGIEFRGSAPVTLAAQAAATKDAKNVVQGRENSAVMIQKVSDGSGRSGYSVLFTGTEVWHDSKGFNDIKGITEGMRVAPSDSLTELTAIQRAALEAMRDAGIKPGDSVALGGHSLGGIYAAGLASNRQFQQLYAVDTLATFGAPVGGFEIPHNTAMLAVEHTDDLVPVLDGVTNPDAEHRATVRVDTQYNDQYRAGASLSGIGAHDMYIYTLGAQGISQSGQPAVEKYEQALRAALPHGPGTRTETYIYEVTEDHTLHKPKQR